MTTATTTTTIEQTRQRNETGDGIPTQTPPPLPPHTTVMFGRGSVRHITTFVPSPIRFNDTYRTLCGITTRGRGVRDVTDDRKAYGFALCANCAKARRVHDLDMVLPKLDAAAVKRAEGLTAPVVEIGARVFRVQGSTNSYTVTVPNNNNLATLCNCMAGKVHPEKQCKHQVKVLGVVMGEGTGENLRKITKGNGS